MVSMVAMVAAGIAGPCCVAICQRHKRRCRDQSSVLPGIWQTPAGRHAVGTLRPAGRVGPLTCVRVTVLIAPWPQGPRRVKHSFDFRWEPAPRTDIVPPQHRCSCPESAWRGGGLKEMGLVLASAFRHRRLPDCIRKRDRRRRAGLAFWPLTGRWSREPKFPIRLPTPPARSRAGCISIGTACPGAACPGPRHARASNAGTVEAPSEPDSRQLTSL